MEGNPEKLFPVCHTSFMYRPSGVRMEHPHRRQTGLHSGEQRVQLLSGEQSVRDRHLQHPAGMSLGKGSRRRGFRGKESRHFHRCLFPERGTALYGSPSAPLSRRAREKSDHGTERTGVHHMVGYCGSAGTDSAPLCVSVVFFNPASAGVAGVALRARGTCVPQSDEMVHSLFLRLLRFADSVSDRGTVSSAAGCAVMRVCGIIPLFPAGPFFFKAADGALVCGSAVDGHRHLLPVSERCGIGGKLCAHAACRSMAEGRGYGESGRTAGGVFRPSAVQRPPL